MSEYLMLDPKELTPWPGLNHRRRFPSSRLEDLTASVRDKGVLQPLLVHTPGPDANGEGLWIVAGETRWRAAQAAGVSAVPCMVRTYTRAEALEVALLENLHRTDLTPVEEARGYKALLEETGCTQAELADRVRKSQPHIANRIRLLDLPEAVLEFVEEEHIQASHARDFILPLLRIDETAVKPALNRVSAWIAGAVARGEKIQEPALKVAVEEIRTEVLAEFGNPVLFTSAPATQTKAPETPTPPPPAKSPVPTPKPPAPKPAPSTSPSPSPMPVETPTAPVATLPPPGTQREEMPQGAGLITALHTALSGRPATIVLTPHTDGARVIVTITPRILKGGETPLAIIDTPAEIDASLVARIDNHFTS